MDQLHKVATYHHRALQFMLDTLGLHDIHDVAHCAARIVALEHDALELIRANEHLRQRLAALELALAPDDAELEALAREGEPRAARVRERGADDI
jgi:hypothetical protein